MKKIICIFCDITGTIIGKRKNSNEDYKNFINIINDIRKYDEADYLIFSLISSDSKDVVLEEQDILKRYFKSPLIFGRQFFENGYIDNEKIIFQKVLGKPNQIYNYINELKTEYHIQRIYFIDDCEIYHEFLSFFAENDNWEELLVSIIPCENNGLTEVNKLLSLKK